MRKRTRVLCLLPAALLACGGGLATPEVPPPPGRIFAGTAGTPGTADGAAATFDGPTGLATDAAGNLYVADTQNNLIRKIAPDGTVATLAGGGTATDPQFPAYQDGPAASALFNAPRAVAVDAQGDVFVADTGNSAIRLIAGGQVTTLAGKVAPFDACRQPFTQFGNVDGAAASATFNGPSGVAVNGPGTVVYVADTYDGTIRVIHGGQVSTLAGVPVNPTATTPVGPGYLDGECLLALFNRPSGLALDGSGNLYVADTQNSAVRRVGQGLVTTVAGTASALGGATFNQPSALALDGAGRLYVADTLNGALVRLMPQGPANVTTVAASLAQPQGLAVDAAGDVFIADTGRDLIRELAKASP